MAKLSLEEVESIAELARLSLTDEEKQMYQDQLSAILDYVEQLQGLDTDDVVASSSALRRLMSVTIRMLSCLIQSKPL